MIPRKKKICKGCGNPEYIWSKGMCKKCAPKNKYVYKRKATGEKELFLKIWEERPHMCTNCQVSLGDEPNVFFFSHDKSKGAHPELRLVPDNINLLCAMCHVCKDHGTSEQFNARKK